VGKDGRCVRLTTLPLSCAVGNLNFLESFGPLHACNGTALPLPFTKISQTQSKRSLGRQAIILKMGHKECSVRKGGGAGFIWLVTPRPCFYALVVFPKKLGVSQKYINKIFFH